MNKKEFQKLPINTGLVLLWLVYKKAKPMATISTDFDWLDSEFRDDNKINIEQENEVIKALDGMGIFYRLSKRFPILFMCQKIKKFWIKMKK